MIEAKTLLSEGHVVHGDPKNVQGQMRVGDYHRHTGGGGDGTAPREVVFFMLAKQGVDEVAVTNHNQLGYDAASRARDLICLLTGRFVNIINGVELTAKSHLFPGEDRHVLIYNAPQPRKLKAFTPLPRLLAEVADQGGEAFLAHPLLGATRSGGSTMSVMPREIDDLVNRGLHFGLEVHNGGAVQVAKMRPLVEARIRNPFFSFIEEQLPLRGSNEEAKRLAEIYDLDGVGGTDLHGLGKSFVLTCSLAGTTVFEAIKSRKAVIVESNSVPSPQPHELVIGTVGGKFSAWRMERKFNRQRSIIALT